MGDSMSPMILMMPFSLPMNFARLTSGLKPRNRLAVFGDKHRFSRGVHFVQHGKTTCFELGSGDRFHRATQGSARISSASMRSLSIRFARVWYPLPFFLGQATTLASRRKDTACFTGR